MNSIAVKVVAFLAIGLLVLGTFSPVLQVYAQADDRRRDGDNGNGDDTPSISEEEAIGLALEFLIGEIGDHEFLVDKVKVDDGDYEIKILASGNTYEIRLDGENGEILEFEIKADDEDEDVDDDPTIVPIISEEDAISLALEALPGPFEEGEDVVERVQINDEGNYKLRILHQAIEYEIIIDGANGEILELKMRGDGNQGRDNANIEELDRSPLVQADEAIDVTIAYLLGIDPTKVYTVDSIEVEDGNYEIKVRDVEQKYELLVDGQNAEVLEFKIKELDDDEEEIEEGDRVSLISIDLQQAIQIALDFLEERDPDFSDKNYTVVEADLKGLKYRIEISIEENEFEFNIDAIDGQVTKFDQSRNEIEPALEGDEDSESVSITLDQAIEAALAYLLAEFPEKEFVVEEVEQDDGNYKIEASDGDLIYKITIDGREGTVRKFEIKDGRPDGRGGPFEENPGNGPPIITIDLQQAIQIALDFLEERDPDFSANIYTVLDAELKGLRYRITIVETQNEFEFKINAVEGTIIEFEMEVEDAELEIDEDNESELKIKVKERDGEDVEDDNRNAFNLNVGKQQARLTTNFNTREEGVKSQLELQLLFTSLEEFLDAEGDGSLNETDTILRTINLNTLSWSVTREEILGDEGELIEILVIQEGSSEGLERIAFIYHLTPTTRDIEFSDETVASVKVWEVKFDIEISGFDWSDEGSLLALSARFNNQFKVKALGDAEVRFEIVDEITPFFNWGGKATADGEDIDVTAIVNERVITLSYPHFEGELIHDPSIGYIVSKIVESIILVPMIMAIGAVIAVTAVLGSSLVRQGRLRKGLEETL